MSHENEEFGRRSFLSFDAALAAASAFALVLLAAPSYAQTVTQKETTMTQLNPVPYTATPAVRPFVTFALSGEMREGLFRSL